MVRGDARQRDVGERDHQSTQTTSTPQFIPMGRRAAGRVGGGCACGPWVRRAPTFLPDASCDRSNGRRSPCPPRHAPTELPPRTCPHSFAAGPPCRAARPLRPGTPDRRAGRVGPNSSAGALAPEHLVVRRLTAGEPSRCSTPWSPRTGAPLRWARGRRRPSRRGPPLLRARAPCAGGSALSTSSGARSGRCGERHGRGVGHPVHRPPTRSRRHGSLLLDLERRTRAGRPPRGSHPPARRHRCAALGAAESAHLRHALADPGAAVLARGATTSGATTRERHGSAHARTRRGPVPDDAARRRSPARSRRTLHLGNGARLPPSAPDADRSERGLQRSFGMMV